MAWYQAGTQNAFWLSKEVSPLDLLSPGPLSRRAMNMLLANLSIPKL